MHGITSLMSDNARLLDIFVSLGRQRICMYFLQNSAAIVPFTAAKIPTFIAASSPRGRVAPETAYAHRAGLDEVDPRGAALVSRCL